MADSMAELFAQGERIRIARDAQHMQEETQRSQLEEVMRDRVRDNLRTTPQYADAYAKLIDPNTPADSIGALAAHLGVDAADAINKRAVNTLAKQRMDDFMLDPVDIEAQARGTGHPFGPGEAPTRPMRSTSVNAMLNARATTENKQVSETHQDTRLDKTLGSKEKIASRNASIAEARNELTARALALRERVGEAGITNANKRTEILLAHLASGQLKDFQTIKSAFVGYLAGDEKATAEQYNVATQAAAYATDFINKMGLDPADAITSAIQAFPDFKPGLEGGSANDVAKDIAGSKKPQAPQKTEETTDKIGDIIKANPGWADTPEVRKKIQARLGK